MSYSGSSGTAVLARHYALNHASFAGKTLVELADWYGVTKGRMRAVLRAAEPVLHRQGLVLCVPMRQTGFVIVITNEQHRFLESMLERVIPITTETTRWQASQRVVGTEPLFDDLVAGLESLTDKITELLLSEA